MLWLCIVFPRLPLEALSLDVREPLVVTLTAGRTRRIVLGNETAEQLGFTRGMDYVTAAAIHPALQAVERNVHAEAQALDRLAAWAYQWSSFVTLQCAADEETTNEVSAVWLEIAASFTLFGGRATLLKRIEQGLLELGYSYRLGVAGSLEGAAVLARAQRRIIADSPEALRRQLQPLSMTHLALPRRVTFELQRAGIRDVGACIDLPRSAVARRFGPEVSDYLDRVVGLVPDPRKAFQLPKKYRARCELGAEIYSTEALLFPLRRMFGEFSGYLRAIDSAVQRCTLLLKHRQAVTRVGLGLSAPGRDAEQLFSLTRERLERVQLPAPVIELEMRADRFTAPLVRQDDFFTSVQQDTEAFQQVLDKLKARLGVQAVRSFALHADHRPEKSWKYVQAGEGGGSSELSASRPLWLLPEPQPTAPPAMIREGPERIESGWWSGADIQRDYYCSNTEEGSVLWVFYDRLRGQWFVHGVWG